MSIPIRYIPKHLSQRDTRKQRKNLLKSRKMYKKGKYYQRPSVKSFKSRPSSHVRRARIEYNVNSIRPTTLLSRRTGCSLDALEQIVNKGRGAYYSAGSRPNQTAESWGIARLASSITGGNSSVVDYHILTDSCKKNSRALKLATKTCRAKNRCHKQLGKSGTTKKGKTKKRQRTKKHR